MTHFKNLESSFCSNLNLHILQILFYTPVLSWESVLFQNKNLWIIRKIRLQKYKGDSQSMDKIL